MGFLTPILHGPVVGIKHLFTLHLEMFTGEFRPMVLTHDYPQFFLLDVILLVTFF